MDFQRLSRSDSSGHDASSSGSHGSSSSSSSDLNPQVLTWYAISLAGLMGIFIVGHWTRILAGRLSQSKFLYPVTAVTRIFRSGALRNIFGFSSIGHALLVTAYVALNVFFAFYRVDNSIIKNFAKRFAWMATGNFALVVFLALRNTPLAFLTAYSYERLNCLHRIAGYTMFVYIILHSSIYTYYNVHNGTPGALRREKIEAGMLAGFCLLIICLAGTFVRRVKYELFYIIHVTFFIVLMVAIGYHRPKLEKKTLIITLLIASMWTYDKILRLGRLAINSINNEATVYPLTNGGTRVVFKKALPCAKPGKHCFIWLPGIRAFETHPFTIVATEPVELVISKNSGFTKALYEYALANPGGKLKASFDGPYGTFPDPTTYDKVVMIAGGSGATFTLGLVTNMMKRLAPESHMQVEFIWVVRDQENVSWFTRYLKDIMSHESAHKIMMKLHLTRLAPTPTSNSAGREKEYPEFTAPNTAESSRAPSEKDLVRDVSVRGVSEKDSEPALTIDGLNLPFVHGRPDIEFSVRKAIASLGNDKRILVAACGPTKLIDTVRDTTAKCISVGGPSVELHCEQFGW
ncbi:ferric reductase NAD binding domain-containing protein [Xylaria nigripes]|nr:ferric reductase NAD binding domain-containing protein [Xylaria nigripes]